MRRAAAFTAILGLAFATTAQALPLAIRGLRRGMPHLAVGMIDEAMLTNPDEADLHSMLGSTWARLGWYADAEGCFRVESSGEWYELGGLTDHADALRELGYGHEAAALRLERRLVVKEQSEMNLLLGAIDDLRYAGDLAAAEDVAWELAGLFPNSSVVNAYLADIMLDQGRTEEGWYYAMRALEPETPAIRARMVEVRLLVAEGDLVTAEANLATLADARGRSTRIAATRARVMRLQGRSRDALDLLDVRRWTQGEHPELLAVRIEALHDEGEHSEAKALLERAMAVYPTHPDVMLARAHVESAQPR